MQLLLGLIPVALWCQIGNALEDSNDGNFLRPILPGDLGLGRRDAPSATLQNQTNLLFGDGINNASIMVNVTLETGENEMILSTEYFSSLLKAVTCAPNASLALTFADQSSYQAAIADWHWVNFNEQRTFILIVSENSCSPQDERQPWVVSSATYDDPNFTVHFNATQKEWQQLETAYEINWGQYNAPAISKRIFSGDPGFTVPLDHTIDKTLYSKTTQSGLDFSIDCDGCGTHGQISFAGHVKTSVKHPLTPSEWWMKVTPKGVEVDLNLDFSVSGTLGKPWSDTKNLLTAPISVPGSLNIPGVIQFGPAFTIGAGFSLSGVHGSASIKSGIKGTIQDSAIAYADFMNKKNNKVDGWKPNFTPQPLVADAEVDGTLEVFLQLAANLDVTLWKGQDQKGMGVDLALKVPDVSVTLGAETNSAGVCPGHSEIFGVKLNGGLGIDLQAQAWKEVDNTGKRETILSQDLLNDPNIFKFPEACIPISAGPKDSSIPISTSGPPASTSHSSATSVTSTTSAPKSSLSTSTATPITPSTFSKTSSASATIVSSSSPSSRGTAGTSSATFSTASGAPWPVRNSTAGLASLVSRGFPQTTFVTSSTA